MPQNQDLTSIWKAALGEIEVELGKSNFGLYFKGSQLISLENGIAKVSFSNKAVSSQANARYYTLIQMALQKASQIEKLSLIFEVLEKTSSSTSEADTKDTGPLFTAPIEEKEALLASIKRVGLRPDFTFEEFCVSTSNQLAFAAAQAVVKNPGKNYNPLFVWGGVGVGKTHLMQAIGHEMLRRNPKARIIYASCEQFTNEIIEGIRNKNTKDFKDRYRSADALLIDDIQFLSGKDTAQEEFFHTFNTIFQNEGQVILTSDRKPTDIKDIFDRLRSRFEGGMVADISTPDSELKTAICLLKARKRGIEMSNETASFIAAGVDNIRTLEGALQRIISFSEISGNPITTSLAGQVLGFPEDNHELVAASRLDARAILDTVCAFYDLPIKLIKGEKRDKPISLPRQILMYLLKKNTAMTLMEIADFLGGRDHTTIIHGTRKIEELMKTNDRIKNEVGELENRLNPPHPQLAPNN